MKIIISNKEVETKVLSPLTPLFNKIFLSVDKEDDIYDDVIKNITEKNIENIFKVINCSWDGSIYYFSKDHQEKVLSNLTQWFNEEKNHNQLDDNGISNCFLIKETPNGMVLIDTQLDMSSNIDHFLNQLQANDPNITYEIYFDCHLIDNIYLGRGSVNNEFELLYLLYKEKVISSSFFFDGIGNFPDYDEFENILNKDKTIVMTGKFPCERELIKEFLENYEIKCSNTVNKESWLWLGEKVGKAKLEKAKQTNCKISTIDEIIDEAYANYLETKKKLKNTNIHP